MTRTTFHILTGLVAAAFAVFFAVAVLPPALASGDIVGAFAAGFVNPFATGYSVDVILCWVLLVVWILYERAALGVRWGFVAALLGLVPGVATGFGAYLILRSKQLNTEASNAH